MSILLRNVDPVCLLLCLFMTLVIPCFTVLLLHFNFTCFYIWIYKCCENFLLRLLAPVFILFIMNAKLKQRSRTIVLFESAIVSTVALRCISSKIKTKQRFCNEAPYKRWHFLMLVQGLVWFCSLRDHSLLAFKCSFLIQNWSFTWFLRMSELRIT
jgi:hypothetical protein